MCCKIQGLIKERIFKRLLQEGSVSENESQTARANEDGVFKRLLRECSGSECVL